MKKLEELAQELEKEIRKGVSQARYAAVRSLNETAFRARQTLMARYQVVFNVRSRSLPKKVEVKKATKENMSAAVSFPFDWMYLNTKGGTKNPEKAKNLSVPVRFGADETRTAAGKIKQSFKPKNLLKYADDHKKKKRGKVASPHAVKIRTKHGRTLIARRKKANRKEMEWLYVQSPTGKVKKKWWFDEIVKGTVERHLKREFEKAAKWIAEHPKK